MVTRYDVFVASPHAIRQALAGQAVTIGIHGCAPLDVPSIVRYGFLESENSRARQRDSGLRTMTFGTPVESCGFGYPQHFAAGSDFLGQRVALDDTAPLRAAVFFAIPSDRIAWRNKSPADSDNQQMGFSGQDAYIFKVRFYAMPREACLRGMGDLSRAPSLPEAIARERGLLPADAEWPKTMSRLSRKAERVRCRLYESGQPRPAADLIAVLVQHQFESSSYKPRMDPRALETPAELAAAACARRWQAADAAGKNRLRNEAAQDVTAWGAGLLRVRCKRCSLEWFSEPLELEEDGVVPNQAVCDACFAEDDMKLDAPATGRGQPSASTAAPSARPRSAAGGRSIFAPVLTLACIIATMGRTVSTVVQEPPCEGFAFLSMYGWCEPADLGAAFGARVSEPHRLVPLHDLSRVRVAFRGRFDLGYSPEPSVYYIGAARVVFCRLHGLAKRFRLRGVGLGRGPSGGSGWWGSGFQQESGAVRQSSWLAAAVGLSAIYHCTDSSGEPARQDNHERASSSRRYASRRFGRRRKNDRHQVVSFVQSNCTSIEAVWQSIDDESEVIASAQVVFLQELKKGPDDAVDVYAQAKARKLGLHAEPSVVTPAGGLSAGAAIAAKRSTSIWPSPLPDDSDGATCGRLAIAVVHVPAIGPLLAISAYFFSGQQIDSPCNSAVLEAIAKAVGAYALPFVIGADLITPHSICTLSQMPLVAKSVHLMNPPVGAGVSTFSSCIGPWDASWCRLTRLTSGRPPM